MADAPRKYTLEDLDLAMKQWAHAKGEVAVATREVERIGKMLEDARMGEARARTNMSKAEDKLRQVAKEALS